MNLTNLPVTGLAVGALAGSCLLPAGKASARLRLQVMLALEACGEDLHEATVQ
jgi:hypothetical protein